MRPSERKAWGARPPLPPGKAARSTARRLLGFAGALLLTLLCAAAAPAAEPGLVLNLVETDTGRVALSVPIAPGEAFTVWFLHSYDRAFFAEHYRALAPGRILLTHMTFKSNLNGEGFEYHDFHLRPDGVGELRNINEPREEVHFMMGSPDMANHTLILRGKRIRLVNYVSPRTLVSFRVCCAPRKNKD
ncbi:MAG: DUF1850 domain-containing protein [Desulfarculaceae bacterium]|nr:DUF1850 domain-containing protein [Desulfarculaceae bacterium]MCF8047855.1 DUF1850 domain-containing protein [Desulfarculaceae bacterium]MCF8066031.1 DUF1850 domain-containing protein [Desulfarculaceae bacterium]MCF8096739.1 DUF1850 domain-containing protein [Desulfarculaceae bacterium]MCF8123035.1 DUF1850 domain-containing protein [Desulfarculaceae bacterium]